MLNNLVGSSVFYVTAVVVIIFSLFVVTLKNIFHCALSLVIVLLAVAVFYIYLNAEFLALVQILIYVGAIMVLVIFTIMLTADICNKKIKRHNKQVVASLFLSVIIAAFLIFILRRLGVGQNAAAFESPTLAAIGRELLTTYALPFEFISIILLSALIAAVTISRKE